MKASEFVGRVVGMWEFQHSPTLPSCRPETFSEAHLSLRIALHRSQETHLSKFIDGYTFVAEAHTVLGHQVIRATMYPGNTAFQVEGRLNGGIQATVCFTLQDYETESQENPKDNIYENYHLPVKYRHDESELLDMLAYLTLKTNNRIVKKYI